MLRHFMFILPCSLSEVVNTVITQLHAFVDRHAEIGRESCFLLEVCSCPHGKFVELAFATRMSTQSVKKAI